LRLVVQRHANAAVPGNQPLEIDPFVTENRRPDKRCRGRIHQPLAADRDLENIVPVDARAIGKSCEAGEDRAAECAFFSRDPLFGEAVHQLAGIIDQRILHAVGRDDDDGDVAESAARAEENARPATAGGGELLFPQNETGPLKLGGDGGDGCGGKPGERRHVGMGKAAVQAQRRHHRQAVFLAHQFRTCNGGHGLGHAP
jgi:hypothetical protein